MIKFLLKTVVIILCVLLLAYLLYFKKDFIKRSGDRVERWLSQQIESIKKETKVERVPLREKAAPKKSADEEISEKDRLQLEKIIEEKGK